MLLETEILKTGRFSEQQKKALKKLKIETVEDLLYHFPVRYGDYNELSFIKNLKAGDQAIIYGEIKKIQAKKTFKTKMTMTEAVLEESSGDKIQIV
jgi:ATP-dependent DNA helicase RecG